MVGLDMGLFFVITPYQPLVNLVEMPHLTVYKPQPQHIYGVYKGFVWG